MGVTAAIPQTIKHTCQNCCAYPCFVDIFDGMATPTATRRLLDLLLDGKLDDFVHERRAEGQPWRIIARDVHAQTGVDITPEALRSWYAQDPAA